MDRATYLREIRGYFHWLRIFTDDCRGEVLRFRKTGRKDEPPPPEQSGLMTSKITSCGEY